MGPAFCFAEALPWSRLPSALVGEIEVLRREGLPEPSLMQLEEGPSRWREERRKARREQRRHSTRGAAGRGQEECYRDGEVALPIG